MDHLLELVSSEAAKMTGTAHEALRRKTIDTLRDLQYMLEPPEETTQRLLYMVRPPFRHEAQLTNMSEPNNGVHTRQSRAGHLQHPRRECGVGVAGRLGREDWRGCNSPR
jgi:hypothetical protein